MKLVRWVNRWVNRLQQPDWGRIGRRILRIAGMMVIISAVLFVINRFFVHRELWDWLKLLVVPAVIAAGGLWFNTQQREREQRIASERAQDDALQGYLDGMSQLLTDKDQPLHQAQPGDNLSIVARARTLTILSRLDSGRKRSVLEFLYESRLIDQQQALLDESNLIERRHNIVSLQQADLIEAYLIEAYLSGANLSRADLSGANLSDAYLTDAYLTDADLSGARGWTMEQLEAAKSLKGAIMPNGHKYEDWLKSKGRGEGGENGGPS